MLQPTSRADTDGAPFATKIQAHVITAVAQRLDVY